VSARPVVILGVSRSGTTLLKEMLDGSSELAIPSESYFIPQLWDRHGDDPDPEAILDDLGRIARVREWGVSPEDVREQLPEEPSFREVIEPVYRTYAEGQGKERFGDKTPAYMQHLELVDNVFPGAQYVHIVRDGRDAGLSFLAMHRRPRFNWSRPRGLGGFACQWELEVRSAQEFGATTAEGRYLELRYEDLVAEPEPRLKEVCDFLDLPFESDMLEYHQEVEPGTLEDHARLAEPPAPSERDWRDRLSSEDTERFEAIAGELLEDLGYPRAHPEIPTSARARARAARAAFRLRVTSWKAGLLLVRRSPLWRARQVYIRRTSPAA
jgi:hypothetical protein